MKQKSQNLILGQESNYINKNEIITRYLALDRHRIPTDKLLTRGIEEDDGSSDLRLHPTKDPKQTSSDPVNSFANSKRIYK